MSDSWQDCNKRVFEGWAEERSASRRENFKGYLGLAICVALVRMTAGDVGFNVEEAEESEVVRFVVDWFNVNGHHRDLPAIPLALRGFGV